MVMRPDTRKAEILQELCDRAREQLPDARGEQVERFLRAYYRQVTLEELAEREPVDLYGAAMAHWRLLRRRQPAQHALRLYNPDFEEHGWQSSHSCLEICTDDMPFLVDSISICLNRHGFTLHQVVHPLLRVQRDSAGVLLRIVDQDDAEADALSEAALHVEFDRETDPALLRDLERDLDEVLKQVRAAVDDWLPMRERVSTIRAEFDRNPPSHHAAAEVAEVSQFLDWVERRHFTFLGFEHAHLDPGERAYRVTVGSGLGILRDDDDAARLRQYLGIPVEIDRRATSQELLAMIKARARSTIHRPVQMDHLSIKQFDDAGRVAGEYRFLGLYTGAAYQTDPRLVPIVRRKVEYVLNESGLPPRSHSGKALLNIILSYPRDELFQAGREVLYEHILGILHLEERQRVRLFVREDLYKRFVHCMVFVPRDHYNTEVRLRMQAELVTAFNGENSDFDVHFSESLLARINFTVHTQPGSIPGYDVAELEQALLRITRNWQDEFQQLLLERHGEEHGNDFIHSYRDAFPVAYREDYPARTAVHDIERMEAVRAGAPLDMVLYRPPEAPDSMLRFKLFRCGSGIPLTQVLPMLENMGVVVLDERPYEIEPAAGMSVWVHDFGLRYDRADLQIEELRSTFQDAFAQVWTGQIENDGFNRLVLRAGLPARDIAVLRAYCKYLRQIGIAFSQSYMEESLANNPGIARLLTELFQTRFDPARQATAKEHLADLLGRLQQALDAVVNLDEDRILRRFLDLIEATLRTNRFQCDEGGRPKPYLSFKLACDRITDLPLPRPLYEIFVYSPRVEGVHLRGGKVARGGLRWSSRREDFRTEILGLMKAQTVKNTVIVPVGAKGGFVIKRPPDDGSDLRAEAVECYRLFIRGLLDLTDNRGPAGIVPPPAVVRYDDDDPYLVVAADKGTATFSDIANAVAADYGHWMGDAFASGGSAGYDHKKLGITARGAWESVRHLFAGLGRNVDSDDFTVVGIGDMAGDVFGNGMLLSRHICLIGAFNHQHIFLDPTPDPSRSFAERSRLFETNGCTWADYRRDMISPGGGVFARSAKAIRLSPEIRTALDVSDESLTPDEVIRVLLRAPVDLLWSAGIGTFVKASRESHTDAGDRANDALRVDANELRCKVVGEGGNLGFTQGGRMQFAHYGGRINTDFIDNSGGVDCSDREVNIKILLNEVVVRGDLTLKQRNQLLVEMADEVAALVLDNNYRQARAVSVAETESRTQLEWYRRVIAALERGGEITRSLEELPDDEALGRRRARGQGLQRPEIAVIMAHQKIALYQAILASEFVDDPHLESDLERYFPRPLWSRFATDARRHRLRREIIATVSTNRLVNHAGITFVQRLRDETAASLADLARAHTVTRDVFEMGELWQAIDTMDGKLPQPVQIAAVIDTQRLLERGTRWFLRHQRENTALGETVERFRPAVQEVAKRVSRLVAGSEREALDRAVQQLRAEGMPSRLAYRIAGLEPIYSSLDIHEIAATTDVAIGHVIGVYFQLGSRLDLHWLRQQTVALPADNSWQERARTALTDELYDLQAALTALVLRTGSRSGAVDARVEAWLERHNSAVERCQGMLAELKSSESRDLAMLSVAARALRALLPHGIAEVEYTSA
ncbi:MAG: NAD-glutamate dehydrogenase [Gammaproteobacteria bacterium]